MDLPIEVTWPPMLYTDRSGQKWAVSGQHWVEVPDTLTLDEVSKYMIVEQRETPAVSRDDRSYEVQGSKGNTYKVTKQGDKWKCQCSGFQFRGKCKHITNLKILLEA